MLFLNKLGIHLINLNLVDLAADIALQLKRGCGDVVSRREVVVGQPDILGLLEAVKLTDTPEFVHLVKDHFLEVGVLGLIDGSNLLAVLSSPLGDRILLRHNNGDTARLERVTMDHKLGNKV